MDNNMPFTQVEIARTLEEPFQAILDYLVAYYKLCPLRFEPAQRAGSCDLPKARVSVYLHRAKVLQRTAERGGGAIDFMKQLTGLSFVPAVKVCLDSTETPKETRR